MGSDRPDGLMQEGQRHEHTITGISYAGRSGAPPFRQLAEGQGTDPAGRQTRVKPVPCTPKSPEGDF